MNSTTRIVGCVGIVLLISGATSHAQDWRDNLYIHTALGPSFIPTVDSHFNVSEYEGFGSFFHGKAKFETDPGIRGDLSLGCNLTKCWAVELQSGAIWNPGPGSHDCFYQIPVMLNAIYQVDLSHGWKAYMGAGGGAVTGISQTLGRFANSSRSFKIQSSSTSLGAQGQAGIKYSVSQHVDFDLGYNVLWIDQYDFNFEEFPLFTSNVKVNNLLTHSVQLSFTWKF